MPTQDTRDRLIVLEAHYANLLKLVEKNSTILADLHEAHLKAKGGVALLRGLNSLASGGAGAAAMAVIVHFVPSLR